jgi:hypothetical protein
LKRVARNARKCVESADDLLPIVEQHECRRSAPHDTAALHVEIAAEAGIERRGAPAFPSGWTFTDTRRRACVLDKPRGNSRSSRTASGASLSNLSTS